MMGADVEGVNVRSRGSERRLHVPVKSLDCLFTEVTSSDAGLICNNDDPEAVFIQQPHRFVRTLNPLKILNPVHVPSVDVEDAIAV
jgi:hypothetical protein